jgi:hypothetical protein
VTEDVAARLRRLGVQIRAFREMHVREVGEVAERLATIAKLQADELQLILDELADIRSATEDIAAAGQAAASVDDAPPASSDSSDPAAGSPKRARWLAEQERRAHRSRRELLRGRDSEGPASA